MRLKHKSAIIRPDIQEMAYEYLLQDEMNKFIATQVFPIFNTGDSTGIYSKIELEQLLKPKETLRAPRTEVMLDTWEYTTGTFNCKEHGFGSLLDDREMASYPSEADAYYDAMIHCMSIVLQNRERIAARVAHDPANAAGVYSPGIPWSDTENSTPVQDIADAVEEFSGVTGLEPNALIIGKKTLKNLLNNKGITDYLQYTQPHHLKPQDANTNMLGQIFSVDNVIVGSAQVDAAPEGKAASLEYIWGNDEALLARVAQQNSRLKEPSFGRMFVEKIKSKTPGARIHSTMSNGSKENIIVETFRDEHKIGDLLRVRTNYEMKIIVPANLRITNITV